MLTIHTKLISAMITQSLKDHPIETCGIIAGLAGSNLPLRLIPMRNVAQSENFFMFDPQQQLQVWKEMSARHEEPVVIYHSHTGSEAYPSRSDVELAAEPQAHYVIIPTCSPHKEEIRSFRIVDQMVIEERVQIVRQYQPELEFQMMVA
ncbi:MULTISPECIES: M67 family metallopeptidase [Nitrosomonas]|uniref:Mov34 family n=2 Tax=Nitrosomonadaceae TaxID=206379 RepID=Q82SH4_NITEU|nr:MULTISPECIES: M67 family metallopeptidase [Nitrosomonas]KXK41317.1 MAG: Mov34 family protein [Nitrosomonas europaea]MBV6389184.1 CysO-cysteine peptidase [Nitrosomonas europaea]MEB2330817.1 M67 family metallopeptidase [Nitrosomonas sp.]QOJ10200.1 MAG: M67 family metallopeptidase [Nitrosomonas sp. H1_AOB3]CAD86264.1 Mov34 family [Nitrosomonas europaea ATCC 19718]